MQKYSNRSGKNLLKVMTVIMAGIIFFNFFCGCGSNDDRPNDLPLIQPIDPVTVKVGSRVTLSPTATDPDNDSVTFVYSGWMTTNSRLATVSDLGNQNVTVTALDGHGGSNSTEVIITVIEDSNSNESVFELAPSSPWDVPFPSDAFTTFDSDMVTGLRLNLPLPDASKVSERADVQAVNVLDGFSVYPRLTVPFTGEVPDPGTFNSSNVFLCALSGMDCGTTMPIDLRIIDDSTSGSPRLIFGPNVYLRESSRYALVITSGLTAGGTAIKRADALTTLLHNYEIGQNPLTDYETKIHSALDDLLAFGTIDTIDNVLNISVFTTRTVTDLPVKLRDRLDRGGFTVSEPTFDIDNSAGNEVFDSQDIESIDVYEHRASVTSDGSSAASYPEGALISSDLADDVYIENIRTGARTLVDSGDINSDGSVSGADVSGLSPQNGDELALLVLKQAFSDTRLPFGWNLNTVDKVVFGSFTSPDYRDSDGKIPFVKTKSSFVPSQTGTNTIRFILITPYGTKPSGGWPLTHYAHGGGGSCLDGGTFAAAPVMASRGIATLAFTAHGHGGGPHTAVEVTTSSGTTTLSGFGRAGDHNDNDLYQDEDAEGRVGHLLMPRISDFCTLVRSVQLGADFEGDSSPDLTTDPEDTFIFGISYGGRTSTVLASIEPNISLFAPNVPGAGGAVPNYGYFPRMAYREATELWLALRTPSLINEPSPVWGSSFNEDIPLKDATVQVGLASGAELIQRALDFRLWDEQRQCTVAYGAHVTAGDLRGEPAGYFLQIARGDGLAINPIQRFLIKAAGLENASGIIRCDNEPNFDATYTPIPGTLMRHILLATRYSGFSSDVGGKLCHFARMWIADYFEDGGATVGDPDGTGTIFAGDVYQYPIPPSIFEEIKNDPGF